MWKNKVVIITGSSIGIGRRLAIEIGRRGGSLVINARNKPRLLKSCDDLMSKGYTVSACQGDISRYEDCVRIINHTIKTYGKIDVLFNNAAITGIGNLEDINPLVFKSIIDINLLGTVYMTKLALPYIKQSRGSILFVGSQAGIHGLGNYSAYCCSKKAMVGLVESLRKEVYNTGIHIGLAYVGFTENDPEKTFLNKDGILTSNPERIRIKPEPANKVALQLMRMIERRKKVSSFTLLGKLNAFINRISPNIVHRVILHAYIKDQNRA